MDTREQNVILVTKVIKCKVSSYNYIIKCSIQSGLLKVLYIIQHGRPVPSDTISTSLGSIQPHCKKCIKTIRT